MQKRLKKVEMYNLIKETINIIKRNIVSIILINRFFKNFDSKFFGVNGKMVIFLPSQILGKIAI